MFSVDSTLRKATSIALAICVVTSVQGVLSPAALASQGSYGTKDCLLNFTNSRYNGSYASTYFKVPNQCGSTGVAVDAGVQADFVVGTTSALDFDSGGTGSSSHSGYTGSGASFSTFLYY
jgi:hypothetical protein